MINEKIKEELSKYLPLEEIDWKYDFTIWSWNKEDRDKFSKAFSVILTKHFREITKYEMLSYYTRKLIIDNFLHLYTPSILWIKYKAKDKPIYWEWKLIKENIKFINRYEKNKNSKA